MKKPTVTIGIPAFNEEQNIESFLHSLLDQQIKKIKLEKILVYSDASSDKTDTIVRRLSKQYPVIKLVRGTSRKGKYFRVNELFHLNKSDVLIILDADVALVGNAVVEKLALALVFDKNATMVAGHVQLVRPRGFIAKIIHTNFVMFDFVRLSVPGYDVAANFHGVITAYRGSFIRKVNIPDGLSDPHTYIYYSAKEVKGFRYYVDAVVLQYAPSTFKDVRKLLERPIGKSDAKLEKIFGKKLIAESQYIPTKAKFIGLWKCFLWKPLYTPLAVLINYYFIWMLRSIKQNNSPIWDINQSTKRKMNYAK